MYAVGCDDLQFFCKKSFGSLIFECQLAFKRCISDQYSVAQNAFIYSFNLDVEICSFLSLQNRSLTAIRSLFEILAHLFASTFGSSPYQALTIYPTNKRKVRTSYWENFHFHKRQNNCLHLATNPKCMLHWANHAMNRLVSKYKQSFLFLKAQTPKILPKTIAPPTSPRAPPARL